MSLTKLLKSPMSLFARDVITFFKVHRYDLGSKDDRLRYIAIKPRASVRVLRQKVWYLLDLPDYCDEVIILKTDRDVEVPLTELRKGNDPHHPYVLEVWLPDKYISKSSLKNEGKMLTMGLDDTIDGTVDSLSTISSVSGARCDVKSSVCTCIERCSNQHECSRPCCPVNPKLYSNTATLQKDYSPPDLLSRVSSTSMFFKLQSKKGKDNFANILLRIQSDLSTLNTKLSHLEEKIPM